MSSLKLDKESVKKALTKEIEKSLKNNPLSFHNKKAITLDYYCQRWQLGLGRDTSYYSYDYDYDDVKFDKLRPGIKLEHLVDVVSLNQRAVKMRARAREINHKFWYGLRDLAKSIEDVDNIAWPRDEEKRSYHLYYPKSRFRDQETGSLSTTSSEELLNDFSKDSLKKRKIIFLNDSDTHHYNFLYQHDYALTRSAFHLERIFEKIVEICAEYQEIHHDLIFLDIGDQKYTLVANKFAKLIETREEYPVKRFHWIQGHLSYDKTSI